jgi:hypothetical protein
MKICNVLTNQNGSALIICLLSLAVLSALGTAALMVSSTNQTIAGNYRKQSQAFFVAEAGLQKALAELKQDASWRGDSNVSEGSMDIGNTSVQYTVQITDSNQDNTLPDGYVRLVSEVVWDSQQTVEMMVHIIRIFDDAFKAKSPSNAVVTEGENHATGNHVINGYDNDGNENTEEMILTEHDLSTLEINQESLKAYADFTFESDLTSGLVDSLALNSFWKVPPDPENPDLTPIPNIIHVKGDLDLSGNVHLYGIVFVEGEVVLKGTARVHGVIYAPNTINETEIKGGGNPNDQPIMGQLICGPGGIKPAGNHGDVQLVQDYVDAFNNFAGEVVLEVDSPVLGSWRQY